MRQITPAQREVLEGPHYGSYLRLLVETESGGMADLSSWVERVTWSGRIDEPIVALSADLVLQDTSTTGPGDTSPLMPAKMVDLWRICDLAVATVPLGTTPSANDWVPVFRGRIDRVAFGQEPLRIQARGPQPALGSLWVKDAKVYVAGDDSAPTIEAVIDEVLDDWAPAHDIWFTEPTGARVHPIFEVQPQSVLQAIMNIASAIGWIIVARHDGDRHRLALVHPQRENAPIVWSFGPDDYYDVTLLDLDIENIRNVIRVSWVEEDGTRGTEERRNPDSVLRYGEQWGAFQEGDESPIGTRDEAIDLLTAALSDLSFPFADQEIETKFFWPVEIGDKYRFQPNGVHYTDLQTWAVVGWQHELGIDADVTRILVRGQPSGSYARWRDRDTRFPREPFAGLDLQAFYVLGVPNTTVRVTVSGNESTQSIAIGISEDDYPTSPTLPVVNGTNVVRESANFPVEGDRRFFVTAWSFTAPDGGGTRSPPIFGSVVSGEAQVGDLEEDT